VERLLQANSRDSVIVMNLLLIFCIDRMSESCNQAHTGDGACVRACMCACVRVCVCACVCVCVCHCA